MTTLSKIYSIRTLITFFSCIGSSIVIISTLNYGAGLSPDSIEYLATAKSLLQGKGFLSYNGLPITEWPPLYPVLLSLLSYISGFSSAISAVLLNSLLFGLIIYKSGRILSDHLESDSIIVVGILFVLFSIPVFSESLWAHSELLFIFFTILYIELLISYIKRRNRSTLLMIAFITALAILTRYIGITLILSTVITILFIDSGGTKNKTTSITAYSVLSILPISIWLIRNYLLSGTLFGERGESKNDLYDNIYLTISGILEWEIPDKFINLKKFLFLIILCIIVLFVLSLLKKISFKNIFLHIDKRITVILSLFISGYLLFLILISSIKAHNPIDSRLLSPVYIPGTILLFIIFQAYYNRIVRFRYYKLMRIVFFCILVFGCFDPIYNTIKSINYHHNNGQGYSGILWKKYSEEKWLKNIEKRIIKNSAIYSNDPFAVYYLTDTYADWSPRKTYYDSDEIYIRLKDLEGVWPPEKTAYLVWIKQVEFLREPLYTPEELEVVSEMKMIDSSDTGLLYSVKIKNQYY